MTGERRCESLMDVKMHRSEIKESVLAGIRRVASAKLLNQHWHGGGVLEEGWKSMRQAERYLQ